MTRVHIEKSLRVAISTVADPRKRASFSRTFRYPWNEKRFELWNLFLSLSLSGKRSKNSKYSTKARSKRKIASSLRSKRFVFESFVSCSFLLRGHRSRYRRRSIHRRSGLNSVQGQIDERSASFVLRTREKVVAMKTASSVPTFQQHLLGYFHIDVGAEMGSEPRMTPIVVTLNQLERVYGVERGRRGRESWVASWIFSQSNVNSTKTEITGLEGHYNPPATTNVSSNLTTRFLFPSRPLPSPSRYPASR